MNMAQIVAVGLIGTVLCITIKEQRPEISLLIAVTTGVLIFISVCTKLEILLSPVRIKTHISNHNELSHLYLYICAYVGNKNHQKIRGSEY